MPIYLYSNPKNPKEIVEVFQGMNDVHEYVVGKVKWDRVWTKPQAAIGTQWDIDSPQDFVDKSAAKKGSYGQLIDKSKELSDKRKERDGVDRFQEKAFAEKRKQRGGKESFYELKAKADKDIKI